ncbi:hypothetical protein I3843_05G027300 [Carya illinoinensis]|uniref:Uncharacterized protein n=1 Tax=Carya illinoinensis TaxID=32201 RepID=A0A8T1QEB4_CARIL|nr:transcription factor GTE7-like [Carya illinoinensis]KAG6652735.1 hypothetical protein CIPAW_05G026900 [Carya illinoinensis]KAG7977342.1 hypothetical protein I3843_05G027300 [Carya illinoinensis]KAG7977343.1 hypothetical protein I3843_05G027300 [Carya illinoinensis]KAG7977349.1 hypothetical protein I3843_05G027300 [Carya illinoinensis]KAG7977350.1 hypothetical protein I3843_05G027300 [Carya illinoinensis]
MASAVLARTTSTTNNRAGGGFMGKVPFSNPNPNFTTKKRQQQQQSHPIGGKIIVEESPDVTQSAASDDASSINHRRHTSTSTEFNNVQYLSFNVASLSKKQLGDLKTRLAAELDQIRELKHRLESHSTPNHTHAPPPSKKSKKLSGKKRPLPGNLNQKNQNPSPNLISSNANNVNRSMNLMSMKACKDILTKLRKHKSGWVFNEPVDVVGMGLHDYHDIIKQPMDLGTVKSRLGRNLYQSPLDFAADVRLTFTNALTYNPKGHTVHAMAELLLARFEELFRPFSEKIDRIDEEEGEKRIFDTEEELQASDNNNTNSMQIAERSDRVSDHSEPLQKLHASSSNRQMVQSPVKTPPVKPVKQPKPKAKDPNKREMSLEEKHKLGIGLQSLPPEKMEQVVQIIRKRNGHLKQDGDEIELDIEAVDTETLWELDRLVTNWKKMVSKIKRQALMGNYAKNNGELPVSSEKIEAVASEAKKSKKGGEVGEEDVDIGDEMPMSNFPPVEIEKDVGGHGSSSSSSSSSSSDSDSSSSDSDSGSSSGSDSDADNAQS